MNLAGTVFPWERGERGNGRAMERGAKEWTREEARGRERQRSRKEDWEKRQD